MKEGLVSRGRPSVAACRPTSAHLPFAGAALGLLVLVLMLLVAPTAEAVQQGDNYYSRTASILRFLDASALDGPQQQQQQQHEESVASQVAACAKSLSLSSTRQLLPSAAFAAKAASTTSAFTPRPVASGPAFLVVTSGSGGDGEESEAGVVEATLRIHGVGVGAKQQHQQHHRHHRLRGVVGSHLLLRDDDEGEGALGLYAPTPECAAASQSVSHLYAHGRIPHYVISVAAQQQAGQEHEQQAEDDKEEAEPAAGSVSTNPTGGGDDSGRLCAEAREGETEGEKTRATRVCVDREVREGKLGGTVTNVGTAPLCGAALRVLAPLGVGPHRHAGEGPEGNRHHEAKRLSRAVPLFEQGAPPMGDGELRQFVVEVDREAAWAATAVEAVYGLLIDPDYDSCSTITTPATTNSTTITTTRRLDATTAAGVGGASNAADIRAAKRKARKRRKEARQASKGVNHKLHKLKKVKKIGGMVVKAGTRKWRRQEKKKARLAALAERKRMRQQRKAVGGGLAAVGNKGLAGAADDDGVPGVRVGTLNGAVAEGQGDKGLWFFAVPGIWGAKRRGFKQAARGVRQALRRAHKAKGKGKAEGVGKPAPALVHLV